MSVTIKIDTRSNAAKRFLAYVKTLSFAQVEENRPRTQAELNEESLRSLDKTSKGIDLTACKNADDMFKKLGI